LIGGDGADAEPVLLALRQSGGGEFASRDGDVADARGGVIAPSVSHSASYELAPSTVSPIEPDTCAALGAPFTFRLMNRIIHFQPLPGKRKLRVV